MKEQLVSKETAVLAKEKGFDWDVKEAYYAGNNQLSDLMRESCWDGCPVNSEDEAYLSAPIQSLLQRWLREVHLLEVISYPTTVGVYTFKIYLFTKIINVEYFNGRNVDDVTDRSKRYDAFEDALESGLQAALNKIIKIKQTNL